MRRTAERLRGNPVAVMVAVVAALVLVIASIAVLRRSDSEEPISAIETTGQPATRGPCVILLHGKGGSGSPTVRTGAYATVSPTGNAAGWGGRQWQYFPDADYSSARRAVADAIDREGCDRVVLKGFSNGAAFAAKLYCRSETFNGRVVGVVVDDPVTDRAVEGCAPAPGVRLALYWTGALEGQAQPGWACATADWTCERGSTIGIRAYAAALGVAPSPSPNREHAPFVDAPEPATWLAR